MRCTNRVPMGLSGLQVYFSVFLTSWNKVHWCFLATAKTWAAIRSRSRRPWELIFRPPLGSFSTNFKASKVCRAFLAILPDPERQWLGELPLFRLTVNKNWKWGEILIPLMNEKRISLESTWFNVAILFPFWTISKPQNGVKMAEI